MDREEPKASTTFDDIFEVASIWFAGVGALIAVDYGNWFALGACVWLGIHTIAHWDN